MEKTNIILKTKNISKSFGSNEALNDINLNFMDNKIYGIFGRNGAGKTTFLDIISSRIFADNGSVFFIGKANNTKIIAESCCYMQEKHFFPFRLKVKELLFLGKMSFPDFNEEYAYNLCRYFNLNIDQKFGQLSRGFQSILKIIFGLAAQTPVTIFDEPVLGLDAVSRDKFYSELIEEFSRNPRLFIISTHFIEESADIFNEIVIIDDGKVIKQGPTDDLLSNIFYVSGKPGRVDELIKNHKVLSFLIINNIKTAIVEGSLDTVKRQSGLTFSSLTIQKLFIYLTDDHNNQEKLK